MSAAVSATVADLRELGSRMLSFYGQHEHRKLMLTTAQLDALDAFCGAEQLAAAHGDGGGARARARLEARIEELDGLVGARDRELDLIGFELREIEEVDPSEEEESRAAGRARPPAPPGGAAGGAAAGADALAPEEAERCRRAAVTRAAVELEAAAAFDPALAPLAGAPRGAAI